MLRPIFLIPALLLLSGASSAQEGGAKQASTFYGEEARANAVRNAERYEWARKRRDKVVAEAEPWIETSDEDLWNLIFAPEMWRAMAVNVDRGCPNCGKGVYQGRAAHAWPWIRWIPGKRWKMQCPNCREIFPKNDFGKFYQSGISPEDGLFHYDLADQALLFNADHPDPRDPKHKWCVDDGRGWQREAGGMQNRDYFVANHVGFGLWQHIGKGLRTLADAYALTSKPIYAHKCAILLDRLADVFPGYDGKSQLVTPSTGGFWPGLVGPNYWDGAMWGQRAIDFDKICDGIGKMPETIRFLRAKSKQYRVPLPKETVGDIKANIVQRILVAPMTHRDRIDMNGASTEIEMAKVEMVRRGRGSIAEVLKRFLPVIVPAKHLNNDGSGNERSTGYDSTNFSNYAGLIDRLYAMDPEAARALLKEQPRLAAAFRFWPDIWCLESFVPNIGDTRSPGAGAGPQIGPGACLALYDLTGDARFAYLALHAAKNDPDNVPRNIYAKDPEGLVRRAAEAAKAMTWETPSIVKPDYKLAVLRSGMGAHRAALWFFYSPARGTSSHSHFDALAFGLYAYGLEMVCEQGYPLFTGGWPARWNWTSHTRSHATVLVDGQCQKQGEGGRLLGFDGRDGVQMISAEAPGVPYPQARVYRRTMILAITREGRSFIVDLFRVHGGGEHTYTIPFFYGDRETRGVEMRGHPDLYEGYVSRVVGGPAATNWNVDTHIRTGWNGNPTAHLRIHGMKDESTTIFLALGETRNGREARERLPYVLLRRKGRDLESVFVVLYEPYKELPFLPDDPLKVRPLANGTDVTVNVGGGKSFAFTIRDFSSETTVEVRKPGCTPFTLSGTDGPN